ncbi:arginine--tRNA ligase [Paenibacillus cremeus]|uniref:Arginine--tRNA ligase n=1 Tax=Paenibacillus cremeus TaxID=2163881 RepID=A0A559KFH3_9BACL|nr:arginine--tRNA ligase [Paenibacillus cremeus]TVY10882.1 arginine--tRNA ligase [Paenibacillus cremeus]
MLSQWLVKHIQNAVQSLLDELGAAEAPALKVRVEQPALMAHGDYSASIAMQLAKVLRKPPQMIAGQLMAKLEENEAVKQLVLRMEVAPPGYINLFIDWTRWAQGAFDADAADDADAGQASTRAKVVIEHTSINPNKSAHIGHLRNSCIGDALVRIMKRTGYSVEVHNYIDDLGNQLADTVVGMLHNPIQETHMRFGDFCWDVYAAINRAYESEPKLVEHRTEVLHALEEGHSNLAWMGTLVAERIVREHVEEMKQFGIDYDLLVWESNIVREGFWASAFELLRQTPLFTLETEGKLAGCWVLKQRMEPQEPGTDSEEAPAEHSADKVLVRSNGILTYTAKDIAYHLWKFGLLDKDFLYAPFSDGIWTSKAQGTRQAFGRADVVINVIDYRQQYPQAMVKQALEALGFEKQAEQLRHVSYGVVSLSPAAARELGIDTSDGKASYAMSGRQGIGIKVSQLLDLMEGVIEQKRSDKSGLSSRSIAAAAIRYYLLRFNLQTEVVFDLQQATEISGNTGVYLLYAYARTVSLLQKAERELGLVPAIPEQLPAMEAPEYALLRHIANWPDVLDAAAQDLAPSVICSYAYELATLFSNFYAACPILKAEDETKQAFRIWLSAKMNAALGDALQVLGLPTPQRM